MKEKKHVSMISVRGGFSESIGKNNCCMDIQLTEFDQRTRVILNNTLTKILKYYFNGIGRDDTVEAGNHERNFCKDLISEVFAQKILLYKDSLLEWHMIYSCFVDKVFDDAPYNEVLDIIGYCYKWLSNIYYTGAEIIAGIFNKVFEKEYVGYRFVNGVIAPITDDVEIKEIQEAGNIQFAGCKSHVKKALHFLSDRNTPDYKNSIKESISAVESICKIITKSDNATLGKALNNLADNGIQTHEALRRAFSTLYGYTSDEGGIRHSEGLFESNVTFEEAKFMLVSCCTFVNYLIAEYGKINEEQRN